MISIQTGKYIVQKDTENVSRTVTMAPCPLLKITYQGTFRPESDKLVRASWPEASNDLPLASQALSLPRIGCNAKKECESTYEKLTSPSRV